MWARTPGCPARCTRHASSRCPAPGRLRPLSLTPNTSDLSRLRARAVKARKSQKGPQAQKGSRVRPPAHGESACILRWRRSHGAQLTRDAPRQAQGCSCPQPQAAESRSPDPRGEKNVVRAASGSAMLRPRGGSGVPCARAEKELPCPLLQARAPKRCRLRNQLRSPRAGDPALPPGSPPLGRKADSGPKPVHGAQPREAMVARHCAPHFPMSLRFRALAKLHGRATPAAPNHQKKPKPRDACARSRAPEHRLHSPSPELEI